MLSYASGPSSLPLLGETIGANLRRTVERHGDSEALVVPHQQYRATYQQLWEQTSLVARGLIARGVRCGDRVGIWSPNRFEWVVTQYATARIGAILVNINPAYRTSELEYALGQSGVSFLILARGFRQADYVRMLREVRGPARSLREALVLEDGWGSLLRDGRGVSDEALATIESTLQFDDPINIQYTSGTTGFPKGATLSHHNILNNGFFIGETVKYTARGSRLHPGAVLSLLRHGARQPRLHVARRMHRGAWRGVRCGHDAPHHRAGTLHVAVRRADNVHRRARACRLRTARSEPPAHRDHGRVPVSRSR